MLARGDNFPAPAAAAPARLKTAVGVLPKIHYVARASEWPEGTDALGRIPWSGDGLKAAALTGGGGI
jgi:hypothetical protein